MTIQDARALPVPTFLLHGFVYGQIRRCNRNLLVLNLALACFLGLAALIGFRYYDNMFRGPAPLDQNRLVSMKEADIGWRYYFTVTGERLADIGDTGQEERAEDRGHYSLLTVGDRALIVRSEPTLSGTSVTGALTRLPDSMSESSWPSRPHEVLPMMLDTTTFDGTGWVGLALGALLCAVVGWNLARVWRRNRRPETHPLAVELECFGSFAEAATSIEYELTDPARTGRVGALTMTESWLLQPTIFGLKALRFADLVWIYKKVTRTKYYGVFTVYTRHSASFCSRNGRTMEVPLSERGADELLYAVNCRVPWVFAGYDRGLQKAWLSDRVNLIHAVDQRRNSGSP